MKVEELKIGNKLYRNYEDGFAEEGQYEYTVQLSTFESIASNDKFLLDLYPIPLTEECLVKFNFINECGYGNNYFLKNQLIGIQVNDKKEFFIIIRQYESSEFGDYDMGKVKFVNKIEYVHELQNLFFALEREELSQKND